MNDVIEKQNKPEFLLLLRARKGTYNLATTWQVVQLVATVIVPVALSVISLWIAWLRPYLACYSLLIAVIDIQVIDRLVRRLTKKAAVLSEMFDTKLLNISWNTFVTGKGAQPEDVLNAAKYCWRSQEATLQNWYPAAIAKAPLEIATLVCQRTNLFYDNRVRNCSAVVLMLIPIGYAMIMLSYALTKSLSFIDVVLNVVSPWAAICVWSLRERNRQNDAINANETLRSEVDGLWKMLVEASERGSEEIPFRIRQLQDGIFNRRAQSPLTLPLVYWFIRSGSEEAMNYGAEQILAEAGYPSNASSS